MQIRRQEDGDVEISGLDAVLFALLRDAPEAADPRGDARALDRLFTRPSEAGEEELVDDWNEFVQPELQHLFESSNETVRRDLAEVQESDAGMTLAISSEHLDGWINCLNQARLVLAARFRFEETDMDAELPPAPLQARDFALFQVHLYGYVQESLIRFME